MDETTRDAQIRDLGPWFHNLHLPDGSQTCPEHFLGDFPSFKWQRIAPHLPQDLSGWTVLDIGCNAGFYSIECVKRGAIVTAIDLDPHYLRQAQWAARQFGVEPQIEFYQASVYDLRHWSTDYDLVLFLGVLYHLRYPLLGLDTVSKRVRRLLLFQSMTMPGAKPVPIPENINLDERHQLANPAWPQMAFIEHRLQDDPTNWWAPNSACVEALLRSSGLAIIANPDSEVYLCRPSGDPVSEIEPPDYEAVCNVSPKADTRAACAPIGGSERPRRSKS